MWQARNLAGLVAGGAQAPTSKYVYQPQSHPWQGEHVHLVGHMARLHWQVLPWQAGGQAGRQQQVCNGSWEQKSCRLSHLSLRLTMAESDLPPSFETATIGPVPNSGAPATMMEEAVWALIRQEVYSRITCLLQSGLCHKLSTSAPLGPSPRGTTPTNGD